MVSVTVFPASPMAAVYVGVRVVAPAVIEPAPFSVHKIVPLAAVASPAPTVAVAFEQIVWLPEAEASGNGFTVIVADPVSVFSHAWILPSATLVT